MRRVYAGEFQSLAGVIIIHAEHDLSADEFPALVSIPRGSHHHSRPITVEALEREGWFQSLAGVIIIHARGHAFGDVVLKVSIPRGSHHHSRSLLGNSMHSAFVFQSLAGVIITHASKSFLTSSKKNSFNPSRESSSFTRGEWFRVLVYMKFQSLAGVIIIHARRCC